MDPQRHARVKEVFREALRWPPDERAAVIGALTDDEAVRDEVRSLLAHHDDAPLLREPARAAEDTDAPAREDPGEPVHGAVDGRRTLAELVRAERASAAAGWPLERVIRTLDPIAEALAGGDVHGAVRADHVVLDGPVAALRGGVAHAASLEPASAAPEQLLPALGPVGPWTDVYALGLLCVELMRGRPVTDGSTAAALARTRDGAEPPTPRAVGLEVPAAVEAVLAMALATRPMERYQDVRRFWTALRESAVAATAQAPTPTPTPTEVAPRTRPGRSLLWTLAVAAIAVIAVAVQRCG